MFRKFCLAVLAAGISCSLHGAEEKVKQSLKGKQSLFDSGKEDVVTGVRFEQTEKLLIYRGWSGLFGMKVRVGYNLKTKRIIGYLVLPADRGGERNPLREELAWGYFANMQDAYWSERPEEEKKKTKQECVTMQLD